MRRETGWRFTSHADRIWREGRTRPAPTAGSPTLVWHFAVWRKRQEPPNRGVTQERINADYIREYRKFFSDVNDLIHRLQVRCGVAEADLQEIQVHPIPVPGAKNDGRDKFTRFESFLDQSLNLELWWPDTASPNQDPTRLFVQFQKFSRSYYVHTVFGY